MAARTTPLVWHDAFRESLALAVDSVRTNPLRSTLAVVGIVIGIVTVVLVASVLAGLRNQVALLFRDLGTDNVFAYHLTGDPYQPASERESSRKPLDAGFAVELERLGDAIDTVAVQLIVPTIASGRAITAKAGGNEADTVLVEGASANLMDVIGAEFAAGRPFTELEVRAAAPVAIIGSSLARALFGGGPPGRSIGRTVTLAGEPYVVVGELAPRKGGFFGENRQDSVMSLPVTTARGRFSQAENTVLYIRTAPGRRLEETRAEAEAVLRLLRKLPPDAENDFNLSTSEQIIAQFDRLSAAIGAISVGLAAVSLFIGGLGIANVMIISVTERTREIGLRLAIGAPRREVRRQFLLEAALLSGAGGLLGMTIAGSIGFLLSVLAPGIPAIPPLWAVISGIASAFSVGIVAGYFPARRAASLDPVDALRYE